MLFTIHMTERKDTCKSFYSVMKLKVKELDRERKDTCKSFYI